MAATSHLPYAISIAVSSVLLDRQDGQPSPLSGRGLLASTRQARFAPEIMASVLEENPHVIALLKSVRDRIDTLVGSLEKRNPSLYQVAQKAQRWHLEQEDID